MPDSMETLRAVVELAFPAGDGIPSGLESRAEQHIRDGVEAILPGATDLLAALLDGGALERGASSFIELSPADRAEVFRGMLAEPVADIREAAEAVLLFGYGAIFSEWGSYDRETRTLRRPAVWDAIGYAGPVAGHSEYRDG